MEVIRLQDQAEVVEWFQFLAFESTMGLEVQDNNEIFAQHLRTKRSSSNRLENFMLRIEDRSILR